MSAVVDRLREQLVANPRDAAARAVYADALIQEGDPRGTFITLQSHLGGKLSPDKRESAKHQIKALYAAHLDKWYEPAKGWAETRWKGGFIHAVRADASDFLKNGAALVAVEPVLELTLTDADDAILTKVAASPAIARLSSLAIGGKYGDKGAGALAKSPHIKTLRSLNMRGSVGKAFAADIGTARELVSLCLTGTDIGDEGVKVLAAAGLDHLERLYLSRNELTDASMPALADGRASAHLKLLALNANQIGDEGLTALAKGKSLAHLVRLELRETAVGDEGAKALAKSKTITALKKLDLRQTEVESATIKALKKKGIEVEGGGGYDDY
jgi:uncharacterized protein (TIGR02996 family)